MHLSHIRSACVGMLVAAAAVTVPAGRASADAVQVDMKDLLNANVIVNRHDGKTNPSKDSADDASFAYVTQSAAADLQKEDPAGLPDNGHVAGNDRHPDVQLNYKNDSDANNVHRSAGGDDKFTLKVPEGKYQQFQLYAASGSGASTLKATLHYADGSTDEREVEVPDWFQPPDDTDKDRFVLIGKLDRVSTDAQSYEHSGGAYIFGVNLNPDKTKVLQKIDIAKSGDGVLDLFGATAQTADTAPAK